MKGYKDTITKNRKGFPTSPFVLDFQAIYISDIQSKEYIPKYMNEIAKYAFIST